MLNSWQRRISTGRLNTLRELADAHPHPIRRWQTAPHGFGTRRNHPTFILFTTDSLEAGYRRFIERQLREEYDFEGRRSRFSCGSGEAQTSLIPGLDSGPGRARGESTQPGVPSEIPGSGRRVVLPGHCIPRVNVHRGD